MMKKTLIATATAALIAGGGVVGTASTASAAVYFGSPGFGIRIGPPRGYYAPPPARRVCRPVYQTQSWWDAWGQEHFRTVVVSEQCYWTRGGGYYSD